MFNNKIVVLGVGAAAVVIIAGAIFIAGSSKKSVTTTQTAGGNKEITVGDDVCAEFPKEWVASVLSKKITKTVAFNMGGTNNCQYYIDDTNSAFIKVENLTIANQKTGQVALGRTIKTDPRIKMDNVIAWQPDGLINVIYLVLNPNRYVAIDRTSAAVYDNEGEINFAIKVADRIQSGQNMVILKSSTPTQTSTSQAQVPLPQETDIVHSFFNLIGEHRAADAVSMLAPDQVSNDSQKQAWAVMFNAFQTVSVKSVASSMPEEWSSDRHTYRVTMDVTMKPEAANAAIPYFGYENGTNIRFITLEKVGSLWKVDGIATGP